MVRRNEIAGICLGFIVTILIKDIPFSLLDKYLGFRPSFFWVASYAFSICFSQFLCVIPAIIWLRWQQRWGEMKGVIIAGVLMIFLDIKCFAALYTYLKYSF